MSERAGGGWLRALRDALGLPGLVIALLSLLMFLFGLMVVRRDFGRLERLRDELPRQILGRWVRTASADYLSVRNLVDEAEAWRHEPDDATVRRGAQRSLERLGSWFESQNTHAPLLEVVRVEMHRGDSAETLSWRARADTETGPARSTRLILLDATEARPQVWLNVSYRPDPDLVTLGGELDRAYRRLLVAVGGLSCYSLLCLGYMAFHAHASRRQSARDAAREATLALADRTCHELGNVAFVLTNEGRNLDAHVALLERMRRELPEALSSALERAIPLEDERKRLLRAFNREMSERGLGLETDLASSMALAGEAWRQIEACAGFIGLTVRELDTYLKQSTLPLKLGTVDVSSCVDEALLILKAALTGGGVRVERLEGATGRLAHGERRLTLHAFVNLIKNAIEAMKAVDDRVLRVRVVHVDGAVGVEFHDSGPGVPEALRARIFERGTSTKGTGRGQGLAVARESIASQGGRLELVETKSGACFRVTMPAAGAEGAPQS